MVFVLVLLTLSFIVALAATALRVSGRIFAKTTISWSMGLKYGAILISISFVLKLIVLLSGPAGPWIAVPLAVAVHPALGAFYLGPRVVKDSGFHLGPISGAVVATGAALLALLVAVALTVAIGIIGALVR